MELRDRFGETYWLGPFAPPASWGGAEEVSRWFVGELVLGDHIEVEPLDAQLDAGAMRIWRRERPIATSTPIELAEAPPLLSELVVAERTWIGWEVIDPQGRPVPGIAYELNTPD